ncbi:uncharacterized protein [Montipora capricornis]|uniref:uncharacterized protein n=1 Tax=Montipora capricornis TaxID=246305 RepID=UPI0035F19FEB
MSFAGSAIKQGQYVGRIDCWSQWKPTNDEPLWLLLSGATDPPRTIAISERRTRDAPKETNGAFLAGVTRDLLNMEIAVGRYLHNTVKDLQLTKSHALAKIRTLFDECKRNKSKPMLYYTGHGEVGTGNWCFRDGTISIQEILNIAPLGMFYPMIFSDACYSGHWADFCFRKGIPGFHCLAACPYYSRAVDTKDHGGDLTMFMTGKKPRPCTEPIYSGGSLDDFPVDSKFNRHTYTDLITGFVTNTKNILLWQSLHDGCFSGCFGTSDLYSRTPACAWGIRSDYESFVQFFHEMGNMGYGIYSLACDEQFGFGVFLMKNFGSFQYMSPLKWDTIQKKANEGLRITACAARGSTFYVVMTKETKEYNSKAQSCFISNSCRDVALQIKMRYKEGKVITGICYSVGLYQYFVVMTEEPSKCQAFGWFDTRSDAEKWIDENVGENPTGIEFYVAAEGKFLGVVTQDKNLKVTNGIKNFALK